MLNKILIKFKEKVWLQIFIIYTRYLIGGAFIFASIVKIKGMRFTAANGESAPIDSALHFFETLYQSGIYWKFLGLAQLLAGFLLMTQRFSKLGAAIFLPILTNIFVITISYDFAGTPFITGLMLFANLLLLLWDWNELKVLFNQKPQFISPRLENDKIWEWTGLAIFLYTLSMRVFQTGYNFFAWFVACLSIGFIGLLLGLRKNKLAYQN